MLPTTGCVWRLFKPDPLSMHKTLVRTDDGYHVALHRFEATKALASVQAPILFVHGIASNRFNWDVTPESSLPRFFAREGRDVWMLEFRGHGDAKLTKGQTYGWNFDSYVDHDLPTAIAHIRRKTGSDVVNLIGHSMGGLAILAYAGTFGLASEEQHADGNVSESLSVSNAPIGWIAVLGAPVTKGPPVNEARLIQRLLPLTKILTALPFLPGNLSAKSTSPISALGEAPWDTLIWNKSNMEDATIERAAANATDNIAPGVALQFADWISEGRWRSADGHID
jgi:polyhydroxyalkanoate synthase